MTNVIIKFLVQNAVDRIELNYHFYLKLRTNNSLIITFNPSQLHFSIPFTSVIEPTKHY